LDSGFMKSTITLRMGSLKPEGPGVGNFLECLDGLILGGGVHR
jgi:hypothetical protein